MHRLSTVRENLGLTISTATLIKNNKKTCAFIFGQFSTLNGCDNFEKMTSFAQILNQDLEQRKFMATVVLLIVID